MYPDHDDVMKRVEKMFKEDIEIRKELKPRVPSAVGRWYEKNKSNLGVGLLQLGANAMVGHDKDMIEVAEWVSDTDKDALKVLAKMKNGYIAVD